METHSSILAWKIPRAEEPGGLTVHGAAELDMTEQVRTHVRKLACPLLQREIPYKCSKVVATPTSLQSQPGRKDSLDHPPVHLTGEGVVSTPATRTVRPMTPGTGKMGHNSLPVTQCSPQEGRPSRHAGPCGARIRNRVNSGGCRRSRVVSKGWGAHSLLQDDVIGLFE